MKSNLYIKYNSLVWNKWQIASQGSSYFITKYDKEDHNDVLNEMNVTEHDLIESTKNYGGYYWSGFKGYIDSTPLGVGIIALQILSASKMTQREYREGFCKLMNITVAHLQEAFDYSQHKIWEEFAVSLERHGFKSNIEARQGPWCFVNYPLYQSYLNQQDIESIVPYIQSLNINLSNKLKFDDFISLYRLDEIYRYRSYITMRFIRKLENKNFSKEVIYRQIYQRYLSLPEASPATSTGKRLKKLGPSLLCYKKNDGFFQIVGDNIVYFSTRSTLDTLLELGYKMNKPILLKYDSGMMEYQEVTRFDRTDKVLIVTLSQFSAYQLLAQKIIPQPYNNVFLFFIDSIEEYAKLLVEFTSKKDSSIQLSGGLKIHRKAYLYGYGPTITAKHPTILFLNNEKYDLQIEDRIDLTYNIPGSYEIEVPDEPVFSFYIQNLKNNVEVIQRSDGLTLATLRHDGSDLYGHEITIDYVDLEISTPRAFINYTTNTFSKEKTPRNLVFRNIKRQHR